LENSPDKPTILSPDVSVVLQTRFLKIIKYKDKAFPPVAPNFIVELRSSSDSPQSLHQKMIRWVNAYVDEGISIDLITNPPEVRIYTFNSETNKVIWKSLVKPDQVESEVLKGFVLNMQKIYWQ
ncbi:6292_t:CDS:2, partial [Racocetra fulgida]